MGGPNGACVVDDMGIVWALDGRSWFDSAEQAHEYLIRANYRFDVESTKRRHEAMSRYRMDGGSIDT
jgi:hypothetical protein